MFACVFVLYAVVSISECMTVHRHWNEPASNHIEEVSPLHIACNLTDIVTISSFSINYNTDTLSYLYKPNGGVMLLNITPPIEKLQSDEDFIGNDMKKDNNLLLSVSSYRVENVNLGKKIDSKTKDVFRRKANEFVIGPLAEEDHGNWVLSVFYKDGAWIERFQVITIEITERVPIVPQQAELEEGDTFTLSFPYPIKHLESCQLTVPKSSYDRFYELASRDSCKYIIKNVTNADEGTWVVRAVGRIVCEARTQLKVRNKVT